MKLASPADLMARLNVSNSFTGMTSTVESVLDAATAYLETALSTSLSEQSWVEVFQANKTLMTNKFWLYQRFVSECTIYGSNTLPNPNDVSNLTLITDSVVNYDYGFILVAPMYSYYTISYTSGFIEKAIPSWLKEAGISTAVALFKSQSVPSAKREYSSVGLSTHNFNTVYNLIKDKIITPYNGTTSIMKVLQ